MVSDIVLIDEHPLIPEVVRGMVRAVQKDASFHYAKDLDHGIKIASRLPALTLVLLDLRLSGYSGIQTLLRFRESLPDAPVVIFSAAKDPAYINAALDAGARGYIVKTTPPMIVVAALSLVLQGGVYVPWEARETGRFGASSTALRSNSSYGKIAGLTKRQLEVLRLLAKGYRNSRIAEELHVREGTIKQHLYAIFGALEVCSRSEAISLIIRDKIDLYASSSQKSLNRERPESR